MGVGDGLVSLTLPSGYLSRSVTSSGRKPVCLLQIETKAGSGAERSCSVTTRGAKTVFLLQIETFFGGGIGGDGSFVRFGGDGSVQYRLQV